MNYDFSQKRHWRRTYWNAIRSNLSIPARDALVVYLAGEHDEDREIALAKGFRAENLIAIERDPRIAGRLRKRGVLVLQGDAFEVLRHCMPDRQIDVVALDFCCGLHINVAIDMTSLMLMPHLAQCVFAVNLLRGRDQSSNDVRAQLNRLMSDKIGKHRGDALWSHMVVCLEGTLHGDFALSAQGLLAVVPNRPKRDLSRASLTREQFEAIADISPRFLSYRSTACQTFDSVVFKNAWHKVAGADTLEAYRKAMSSEMAGTPLRSSQAAVFAHRTRRLKEITA